MCWIFVCLFVELHHSQYRIYIKSLILVSMFKRPLFLFFNAKQCELRVHVHVCISTFINILLVFKQIVSCNTGAILSFTIEFVTKENRTNERNKRLFSQTMGWQWDNPEKVISYPRHLGWYTCSLSIGGASARSECSRLLFLLFFVNTYFFSTSNRIKVHAALIFMQTHSLKRFISIHSWYPNYFLINFKVRWAYFWFKSHFYASSCSLLKKMETYSYRINGTYRLF